MRRSTDFDVTVKHGARAVQSDLVIYARRASGEEADAAKVGLIVAKSVGNAVQRHRLARRLRHVARGALEELGRSQRLVIRALPTSRDAESARLDRQLRTGLRQLELTGSDR